MRPQKLVVSDDTPLCPLSVLWFVNWRGGKISAQWSEQFIFALMDAEIPLYYIDEDFDSEFAFTEYRLSDSTNADVRMQVRCAEFDTLSRSRGCEASDHFTKSVCDEIHDRKAVVPPWLGLYVSIQLLHDAIVKIIEPVPIASLFVKVRDVKSACQLQGVGGFCWPTGYPFLSPDQLAGYKLDNGMWQRAIQESASEGYRRDTKGRALVDSRIECLLAALKIESFASDSDTEKTIRVKFPPVKEIYKRVKNDLSFCKHGSATREHISYSTFSQQWKEQLRAKVLVRLEEK